MILISLNKTLASHILENMNPKISPCDDFYEFACGGYMKKKYIGENQIGITEFGVLRDNLNRKLRGKLKPLY